MNILEELVKCKDVLGNYSSTKLKSKANRELYDEIIKKTYFLDEYKPSIRERIFCIEEGIDEVVCCPLTGNKLKFDFNKKRYVDSRKASYKSRKIENKFDHKKQNQDKLKKFWGYFHANDYELLKVDDSITKYEKIIPPESKNNRISGKIANLNKDLCCSLVFHTKDFLGCSDLKMSERVYCLKNSIKQIPTDYKGRKLKFINKFKGYSKYPTKETIYNDYVEDAKRQIDEKFVLIKENSSGVGSQINSVELECKDCGHNFARLFKNGLWKKILCPKCNGYDNRSKGEDEIINFLISLGVSDIIKNDRVFLGNGMEIDIRIPSHNICIEFCGVLWHSFGSTFPDNQDNEKESKYKHFEKWNKCKEQGYQLITIFDNEWNNKKELVKSILKSKFKKIDSIIYARNCSFVELDIDETRKFLNENHLQGFCPYQYSFGLKYNNVLVSIATFGKRKITRGTMNMELLRFCNKVDTNVVGGASKLIKNSNIKNFISYCDLRYSDGNLYETLGMELKKQTKPNYFYTENNIDLFHRSKFQKHKIIKNNEDNRKTERDIMYERGFRRIYDCGNLVFEYKVTK